jgi:sarcosine oxidase subunit alpha
MGWIMSKKKADFIGKRSVDLRRSGSQTRRELVGIMSDDPNRMVPEGAPITPGGRKESSEGFVTAYVWSVALRRTVGLALIENGRGRIGETAHVRLKDETILVKISDPCFYDPKGELLRS